jgi:NAD(P)-dependent dehydrogenase (short-subunit alcohol dehydrogenase family)
MPLLDGKVVVIDGAGSGMGKASVKVCVREGARVVAADISGAERDTAAEVGAVEYGAHGIRINAICPGFILTEIMGAAGADIPGIKEKAALLRAGLPHEVAEVGALLASDRASFLTGAIIPVDGGWSAKLA